MEVAEDLIKAAAAATTTSEVEAAVISEAAAAEEDSDEGTAAEALTKAKEAEQSLDPTDKKWRTQNRSALQSSTESRSVLILGN